MRGLIQWVDQRLPVVDAFRKHLSQYPTPKNLNFWYLFGSISLLLLGNQLLTGLWLAMNYIPDSEQAFASVEYIMRDVEYGWLLRYMHAAGASALMLAVYLHTFRSIMYGSYQKPRELVWLFGMLLFVLLLTEAFTGYLLPWGQMSYWGAQVVTSLFGAIPFVGDDLVVWIRGDYGVSGATLNRFFALHVIGIPLLLFLLVLLHILALHEVGSNNPDGVEIKRPKGSAPADAVSPFKFHSRYKQYDMVDAVPFHPYYTVKDLVGVALFLLLFCYVVFFAPDLGGLVLEHPNFSPADPMQTPEHIAPAWYITAFYAILRAVPHKLLGVVIMVTAILLLFLLPWLDRCPVKSIRYRSLWHKFNLAQFVLSFILLTIMGLLPVTPARTWVSIIASFGYFGFFILLWFYSKNESTKPLPERLS